MQTAREFLCSAAARRPLGQIVLAGILFLAGGARFTIADGLAQPAPGDQVERWSADVHDAYLIVPVDTAGDRPAGRSGKV